MNYNLVINRLKQFYDFKTDKQLCDKLGISSSNLGTWRQRNTMNVECIFAFCQDIDYNWLFKEENQQSEKVDTFEEVSAKYFSFNTSDKELIEYLKAEIDRKCEELRDANSRIDRLIDKLGCLYVSQSNNKGDNINNAK